MGRIFAGFSATDRDRATPLVEQLRNAGHRVFAPDENTPDDSLAYELSDADLFVMFLTSTSAKDTNIAANQFFYAACSLRRPFVTVMLDDVPDLPHAFGILAAANPPVAPASVVAAVEARLARHSEFAELPAPEQHLAEKPFEADEENFYFVSYAHDDATRVYPVIKELYEQGWRLWYDEGIKFTEQYLPVIANHLHDCQGMLLFVSERSVNRPFVVEFELAYAQALGCPVIPVRLDEPIHVPSGVARLLAETPPLDPQDVPARLQSQGAVNCGARTAVPPKDKEGMAYSVESLIPIPNYDSRIEPDGFTILKYMGPGGHVVMPDFHQGRPIVAIESYAFSRPEGGSKAKRQRYEERTIRSVVLPRHLKRIADSAFWNSGLDSIEFPPEVTEIGTRAFGINSFEGAGRDVVLPPGLQVLGDNAFGYEIQSITIPTSVTQIGKLYDAPSLRSKVITVAILFFGLLCAASAFFVEPFRILLGIVAFIAIIVGIIGVRATWGGRPPTVYCTEGSYAHSYALEHHLPIKLLPVPETGNDTVSEAACTAASETSTSAPDAKSAPAFPEPEEMPHALILCADADAEQVHAWATDLYDEGFNCRYRPAALWDEATVRDAAFVLGFFTRHSAGESAVLAALALAEAVNRDVGPVFLEATTLPPPWNMKLHGAHALLVETMDPGDVGHQLREQLREAKVHRGSPRAFLNPLRDWSYLKAADGIRITRYTGQAERIRVPSEAFHPPLPVVALVSHRGDPMLPKHKPVTLLTIPGSVTHVAYDAFSWCEGLREVIFEDLLPGSPGRTISSHAFSWCSGLQRLSFGTGQTTIEGGAYPSDNGAFEDCRALTEIVFGDGPLNLEGRVFMGCMALESVTWGIGPTVIGERAFAETGLVTLSLRGVETIGPLAFEKCQKLTSVTIADGTRRIEAGAFAHCKMLSAVRIPPSVVEFSEKWEYTEMSLTAEYRTATKHVPVFLGSPGVTLYGAAGSTAEAYARANNIPFRSLAEWPEEDAVDQPRLVSFGDFQATIHSKGVVIDGYRGAGGEVVVPDSYEGQPIIGIGDAAFGLSVEQGVDESRSKHTAITAVTLPDTVATIGQKAFAHRARLRRVKWPIGLISIDSEAFYNCGRFGRIKLPEGLQEIGDNAFGPAVCDVTIPSSVRQIGKWRHPHLRYLALIPLVILAGVALLVWGPGIALAVLGIVLIALGGCALFITARLYEMSWYRFRLTIRCEAGSYAHQWAKQNKVHVVLQKE
jgi:hypothetical protein